MATTRRHKLNRHQGRSNSRQHFARRLFLEQMEERRLLAIDLAGVPDWVERGPSPIIDGQTENIDSTGVGENPVIGAVHTLALHPTDSDIAYLGGTNGGVWRSTDFTSNNPTYEPLTDQFRSLSMGALEFDPTDPTNNTLVAGIGRVSAHFGTGGDLTGLLKTTDGGDTWIQLGNTSVDGLQGVNVSGVGPRGETILVSSNSSGVGGVYRSIDGGETFDLLSGTSGLPAGRAFDLVGDPADDNLFYVTIAGVGIYRTPDLGDNWFNASSDASLTAAFTAGGNSNAEIAVSPQTGRIFAGVLQSGQVIYIGFSDNMGDNWTQMDLPVILLGAENITNATNASPIVITTATANAYRNGDLVRISGVAGNTAANGEWTVTNISSTMFSLNGSNGTLSGAYVGSAMDFARELGRLNPTSKPGGQGGIHFSIIVDPNDDDIVYVGGDRQDSPFPNPLGATDFTGNLFRGDAGVPAANPGALNVEFSPQWEHLTHTQNAGFAGGGTSDTSAPHADSREMRFRADGMLIDCDDGGIYARTSSEDNTGFWFSKISDDLGGLQITEMHDIAYDNNADIIISGNQDTGTVEEITTGGIVYRSVSVADGGDVAVDNLIGGGNSLRYSSIQNLGNFRRRVMNAANGEVSDTTVGLNPGTDPAPTGFFFVTPIAVNEGQANRLLIGAGNGIYESSDNGDNIAQISTSVINATNAGVTNGVPIAYGTVDNPEALYVGSGTSVLVRTALNGPLAAAAAIPGGGTVQDIDMDPNDFMHAIVVDRSQVFETFDGGDSWDSITGDLIDPELQTVEYIPLPGGESAILAGGRYGVHRMLNTSPGIWTELGANLPNASVWDMDYDALDDILVVGTMGRGAWVVDDLSVVVDDTQVLTICGDEDHVNQDDVIRLVLNMANPLMLDVYLNSVAPVFTVALAALQQINVFGVGGNDQLIVDSSFGLINVPLGIRYNGDGACPNAQHGYGYDRGFDTLMLDQAEDEGDTQTSHTYSVGPASGSGTSVIVGPSGTQSIFFEELEPVIDLVPADDLVVNATAEPNAINYVAGSTDFRGKIIIDNYETIEFSEKAALTINAGLGDDSVILDNALTPLGLTQIAVNAGGGNDSVVNRTAAAFPQELNGDAGDDFIVGGPENNNISGGAGFDTIGVLGTPGNNVIDVRQNNGTTLTSIIDGDTRTDNFATVEAFRVDTGLGDDIIRVAHSDSLVATSASSRPFEVVGGGPNASDRLAVRDDGIGDTVVYRKGADNRSGSVTVGPLAPVSFEQIEFLDVTPLNSNSGGTGTDGNGRLVVFKPDLLENNNSRTAATHLGAGATISVDPVIDPGAFAPLDLPGDQDWFEFIAAETGVLDLQVFFEQIGTLPNGRAGLPGNGNLSIEVYDSSGTPIGSSITVGDNERIAIPAVRNERYFLRVFGASDGAVNVYNLTVINVPAPVPFQVDLQAGSDSGRNDSDNITNDTTTTFDVYLDDDRLEEYANLNLTPDDDFFVEVYNNGVFLGTATFQGPDAGVADNSRWEFTTDVGDLQEGHNNFITAAVRIRDEADPRVIGRGEFSSPLQVTLDTIAPSGTAHLFPDSDSGIWGIDETMSDLVTSDMTPLLYGAAEANALVRVALDRDPGDPADIGDPDGTAVAIPLDGDEAFPPPPEYDGNYFLQTILSLADGEHTLEVHFQDVAGNTSPVDAAATLVIFVDTAGPKITNVTRGDVSTDNVHSFDGVTSVFEPKPSDNGPDPLVHSIVIHFSDLPDRTAAFADYHALFLALAEEEGNYQVKGDHNGNIAIVDVNVTFITTPDDGLPEIAQVELVFDQPLPDDRYTVWASDNLSDAAGNPLDGESGALGPFEGNNVDATTPPIFPTGDGEHGGDFWGRFTIDSRPEIGTFALGSVYIDINGNTVFDPEGQDRDYTNRDIAFLFGFRDDRIFSGNFAPAGAASASGFDKLGGYGNAGAGSAWHWRLDFNHDGVVDYDVLSGVNTQGDPVAGNFSATHPGDEIGLFNSGKWWLDAGGDNNIGGPGDIALQGGNMKGQPIVGDFDGDGLDDLGTWDPGNAGTQFDGVFSFDFANNGLTGNAEATIQFDVPGVFQKAIAADLNEDGIDDLGLFVTRREGVPPAESAEWFFLVSNVSLEAAGTVNALNHLFTPVPFGNDVYAQFGDEAALPVVGNFDPPTSSAALLTDLDHNPLQPLDVNNDGFVSPIDSLLVINAVNAGVTSQFSATSFGGSPFLDVNGDNYVSPIDALLVINKLNATANVNPGTGGEGEAADEYFSSLSSDADSSGDDALWSLLAADTDNQRHKRK